MFRWFFLLLLLVLSVSPVSPVYAKRVALVIGNGAYVHANELVNPPNDAAKVAAALERLGFQVQRGLDLDKAAMQQTLRQFAAALEGAEVGLFFYAGHGLQVAGINYLVPVDARLESEADLDFEVVDVNLVLRQLERSTPTSVVFLDACRNNPLTRSLARSMGASRSTAIGRGFAQIDARVGTLIAFATEPNNVASDGTAGATNSPFTTALLAHIETPGLEVRQMLTRVRASVVQMTNGAQTPWDNSSLLSDVYFAGAGTAPPPAPTPAPTPAAGADREVVFWESIRDSRSPAEYQAYLELYPDGAFAPLAKSRLAALSESQPAAVERSPRTAGTADPFPAVYAGITGPSFNCNGTLNPLESLLCAEPRLARADGVMGEAYKQLRQRLGSREQQALRDSQRAWLKERDRACPLAPRELLDPRRRGERIDCLSREIEQRALELHAQLERAGG